MRDASKADAASADADSAAEASAACEAEAGEPPRKMNDEQLRRKLADRRADRCRRLVTMPERLPMNDREPAVPMLPVRVRRIVPVD